VALQHGRGGQPDLPVWRGADQEADGPLGERRLAFGRASAAAPQPMFTMMVFLCVKCSSIASSEASLPSPEDFTPP
jgi:hypothetical protein